MGIDPRAGGDCGVAAALNWCPWTGVLTVHFYIGCASMCRYACRSLPAEGRPWGTPGIPVPPWVLGGVVFAVFLVAHLHFHAGRPKLGAVRFPAPAMLGSLTTGRWALPDPGSCMEASNSVHDLPHVQCKPSSLHHGSPLLWPATGAETKLCKWQIPVPCGPCAVPLFPTPHIDPSASHLFFCHILPQLCYCLLLVRRGVCGTAC